MIQTTVVTKIIARLVRTAEHYYTLIREDTRSWQSTMSTTQSDLWMPMFLRITAPPSPTIQRQTLTMTSALPIGFYVALSQFGDVHNGLVNSFSLVFKTKVLSLSQGFSNTLNSKCKLSSTLFSNPKLITL